MALAKRDSSDAKPDQVLCLNKADQYYATLPKDRPVLVQNHFVGHDYSNALQENSIFDQRFSYLGASNGTFGAPLCIQNIVYADYIAATSAPSTAIEYVSSPENVGQGLLSTSVDCSLYPEEGVPNLSNAVNNTKETAPITKNPGFCSRAFRFRQTQDYTERNLLSASKCSKCTRSIKKGKTSHYPRFHREYLPQSLLSFLWD